MPDSSTITITRALMLDTNVWINNLIGANRGHEAAHALVDTALDQGIRLGIAPHSLASMFYIVHRYLKRCHVADGRTFDDAAAAAAKEAAWGAVDNIMEFAEVIGSDISDARIAAHHKRIHDDFEDDLVIAAAMRMGADLLVTDDLALVKHSPIPTMTTADALKWIGGDD